MFDSGVGDGSGVPAQAETVAAPAPGSVDLLFDAGIRVLLTEVGDALAQAGVVGACVARPADQVALASALEPHRPGAALVELLEGLNPREVADPVLIEAIAGWERVTSLAAARQGEMIAELARRRDKARVGEFTGDEVACILVMSRSVADAKVALGVSLDQMPAVHDALATGVIDHRKATALVDGVAHLDPDAAAAVLGVVLPVAPDLTVPALKARMRKVELTVNPAEVADRHARDTADRYVRITPADGAMAWLTAFLPADDAMTVFTAIDAIASSADPADPRGIEARRADALTDVCADILTNGIAPTTALPGRTLKTEHGIARTCT